MAVQTGRMTVEEFERFVLLPENDDRLFEYVSGEVVEKLTAFHCAVIGATITAQLVGFATDEGLGFVTGAACYCVVADERYLPSAAFMPKERQPVPSRDYFSPIPPALVVEVVSPFNAPGVLRFKLANYLAAGIVVWVVDPDALTVEVYPPGQRAQKLGVDGVLDGGEVLPGFTLAVKDIFPG
jgi:Uma2 family endonuclease